MHIFHHLADKGITGRKLLHPSAAPASHDGIRVGTYSRRRELLSALMRELHYHVHSGISEETQGSLLIQTPKTGKLSVEITLSRVCGRQNVCVEKNWALGHGFFLTVSRPCLSGLIILE